MFKVGIYYSKTFEVNRVIDTFKQRAWLEKNQYQTTWPATLRNSRITGISKYDVEKIIQEEFDKDFYQKQKEYLVKNLAGVISQMQAEFAKTDLIIVDKYKLFLTKYGVGGSYNEPNEIIINIKLISAKKLLCTVIHEIVHIAIEPLIKFFKITHWTKERLVDLIVARISPSLAHFQSLPIDTTIVDTIFNSNYPKVKRVLREIGKFDKNFNN